MRSRRFIDLGCSIIVAGAALAACGPGPGQSPGGGPAGYPPPTVNVTGNTTGAAGTFGASSLEPSPPAFVDGGAPIVTGDGGVSCASGGFAGGPGRSPDGGGQQPAIPSTPTTAAAAVPPISGGTLLVTADGKAAVASDPDRDRVYLVDLASKAVQAIALDPGDEPGRLVEDGAGRVHVALRRGGAVVTIDPTTAAVTGRDAACPAPRGLAYQATGDLVHVACTGGELVSLPAAGGAATRTLKLDTDLRDVVVGASGTLLVSTFRKAEVLVVGADGTVTSRWQPGSGVAQQQFTPPQNRTPSVAWRMVPYSGSAGGDGVVMLHQTGVTDAINPVAGGYGGVLGCGGIVQPVVSVLSPEEAAPPLAAGLGGLSLAVDVAVSPDGTKIAVAAPGNAEAVGQPTLVEGPVAQMTQPASGMIGCAPPLVNVPNVPPGQVVAVAYSQTGVLYAQTREPAALWSSETGTTIALASDSRADTGQLIFHANASSGLACASCHPEGGEDGRVWNFVCTGARRTQSIRGGISATAPFHWDGSEHDFSHLMDDVFTGRMSGPLLSDVQKAALQKWVDTIPALPGAAGLDAAAVARGSTLFNDPKVACSTCHAGALLTNNATVDVGTGQPLQVPSLRGVAWRAPYMHNGCATTLATRLLNAACGGGDKHGVTSTLSPTQIDDLEAYLQSL